MLENVWLDSVALSAVGNTMVVAVHPCCGSVSQKPNWPSRRYAAGFGVCEVWLLRDFSSGNGTDWRLAPTRKRRERAQLPLEVDAQEEL
jgi:hypothetical protein